MIERGINALSACAHETQKMIPYFLNHLSNAQFSVDLPIQND